MLLSANAVQVWRAICRPLADYRTLEYRENATSLQASSLWLMVRQLIVCSTSRSNTYEIETLVRLRSLAHAYAPRLNKRGVVTCNIHCVFFFFFLIASRIKIRNSQSKESAFKTYGSWTHVLILVLPQEANSEMSLTKNSYTHARSAVSFKGRGQSIDSTIVMIVHVAAFRPGRIGICCEHIYYLCWKNLRTVISTNLKRLGTLATVHTYTSRSRVT